MLTNCVQIINHRKFECFSQNCFTIFVDCDHKSLFILSLQNRVHYSIINVSGNSGNSRVAETLFYGGEKMPRFFVNTIDENNIVISGSDANHIGRSLRMKPGDSLTVCCNGTDHHCEITRITEDCVYLTQISKELCAAEPDIEVTLFQAIPKLDKLEAIIQKSVELGVTRVVPVLSRRCVSRPSEKDFAKKLIRLNKIAEGAAKQSGRGIIPEVLPMITFKAAVEQIKNLDCSAILYEEEGGKHFSQIDFSGKKTVGLFIGSEGGYDKEEADAAVNAGAEQIWLGKRILRCETAPITALSILMFLTNNI